MFYLKLWNWKLNSLEASFEILVGQMFTPALFLVANKFRITARTCVLKFFSEASQQPMS